LESVKPVDCNRTIDSRIEQLKPCGQIVVTKIDPPFYKFDIKRLETLLAGKGHEGLI
jgi:hypothetical protein